jgi:murein DD-endopeptidase MepM/ murein hydrolase activator NlpD
MWDFLKNIFSKGDGDVTVVVLDDDEPDHSSTFRFQSSDMIKIVLIVVVISVVLTTIIFFVTPIGSLYQHQQDASLRQEVIAISEKVMALRDSLNARDNQLEDLKKVLIEAPDTTFRPRLMSGDVEFTGSFSARPMPGPVEMPAYEMFSRNEIIFSDVLKNPPAFPSSFPVEGTLTQGFSVEDKHFGIDIAAREQSEFKSIADGTVINAGWTVNYGYVVYIQHSDGYMSVYKHGAKLFVETGDMVLKGDLLGTVGDQGALSFGSHLHLEIWKNGIAQDPQMYLIK